MIMASVIDLLLGPLSYPFMVRGLLASFIVGTLCAVVGSYVVLRSMAFLGDALAHAILPGVAVAYLLGQSLFWGALMMGIFVALGIGFITRRAQIKEDTAIGIIFAASFALGVALLSTVQSYSVDLTHILFGNILAVSASDLRLTAGLGAIVLLIIFLFYKELLVVSFDPLLATTLRLPTAALNYLLLILIALTIVVSLQVVGVALMVAMLVTPAATAYMLTRRLWHMMLLGGALGAVASVIGLYLSYYTNVASGSAVVLVSTLFFVLAFLLAPRRGALWTWTRRIRPEHADLAEPTGDVSLCLRIARVREEERAGARLDQPAIQKEGGVIGNARSLLNTVGHHDDGVVDLQPAQRLFDFRRGERIEARGGVIK
jgi:manganese/iron transport system permease protein